MKRRMPSLEDLAWFPWSDFLVIVAMTFAALFATACASPRVRDARHVIAATADAVAMADAVVAVEYANRSDQALDDSDSLADYLAAMRPLDAVEASLRAARVSLLLAQGALDARDAPSMRQALACLYGALAALYDEAERAELALPPELASAMRLALLVVSGRRCDDGP